MVSGENYVKKWVTWILRSKISCILCCNISPIGRQPSTELVEKKPCISDMNFVRCVNSKPVFWQMVSPRDWVPHILLATHHVPIWLHSAWCQTRTSHTWTSYFMLSQVVVPQNSSSLLKLLKWDMHGMCLHLCMMMMMMIMMMMIIYI